MSASMNAPSVLGYGGLAETSDAISASEAATYFDVDVKPLFTANPLKETMNQKYIAFFGASDESTDCNNDIHIPKGLGENLINESSI